MSLISQNTNYTQVLDNASFRKGSALAFSKDYPQASEKSIFEADAENTLSMN